MQQNELERKVEEVKQDADVQRELQRTAPAEKGKGPVARTRDKFVIGTHFVFLIALGAIYQLLRFRFLGFAQAHPLVQKLILAVAVVVACQIILRLIDVYLVGRVEDAVYQYNLKRVARLLVWLAIAFLILTILFQNWYTAVVSFGLISLILGFALQTPITSFIGWVYILMRQPYRVGDRIKIGTATGDVIDVNYLDTTLWEFGGDYLSTDHPSGRLIKFPNSNVLNTPVYNYSWPLFPYIWNEVKFNVAYDSDLEFIAATMTEVARREVGEEMMKQVQVFREILAQTPVDQLEVQERPVVIFRASENTWLEAIVRYLVNPKEAGRVKTRMIKELLTRLNAEPDRVMFPKGSAR
ncbi:MAG TPA: mechanosensitive ion channel domain-containing protein [Pyrinomonadaceae bacterium]|nr:mechanosensitive ion channel domain-containing protein [Pyrinomonadaceae bacterium]